MTPEEFVPEIDRLMDALAIVATLPLKEMEEYIDEIETLGADLPAFTQERREVTAHAARIISASIHLRQTLAMGGKA